MGKTINKTLQEISEEVVQIVNEESTDYDAIEKVLECLEYNLPVYDKTGNYKDKKKEDEKEVQRSAH